MRRPKFQTRQDDLPANLTSQIDSLQRGLEVLRCFRSTDTALELAEVANRMGLSKLTTLRLLETLEQHGFVLRLKGTDKFVLHVACLIVGQAVLGSSVIVKAGSPLLKPFVDRWGGQAMVCVQERLEMLVLSQATAHGVTSSGLGVGMRIPLINTAMGHAWLWSQPSQIQTTWIDRMRSDHKGQGAMLSNLYRSFQSLEEKRVCQTFSPERPDLIYMASPVNLPNGVIAVVGCVHSQSVNYIEKESEQLRNCAIALTQLAFQLQDEASRVRIPNAAAPHKQLSHKPK